MPVPAPGPTPLWVQPEPSSTMNFSWSMHIGPKEWSITSETKPAAAEPAEPSADASSPWPTSSSNHAFQMIFSRGANRFNIIDWEERPHLDALSGLADWCYDRCYYFDFGLGFNIHWWSGPTGNGVGFVPDLPPRVYDLYLDLIWRQSWADGISSEVRFQPGLYTDFRTTPPDSFRVPGHAIGVVRLGDGLQLAAGVMHLQRNDIKLLPVGGLLWQPTSRWQVQLLFPEPKISFQLDDEGTRSVYIRGEYGGGRWTYKDEREQSDRVEYSDFRVAVGFEVLPKVALPLISKLRMPDRSYIEVGYVFERRILFTNGLPQNQPPDGWMISLGHAW